MKIKFSFLSLIAVVFGIHSQVSINSSGGDIQSASGSVSFSIGQVVYNTQSSTNNSIEEGVQHAYVISSNGQVDYSVSNMIHVSPNPTIDRIIIEIKEHEYYNYEYQLITIDGKIIENMNFVSNFQEINLSSLTPSTYFLNIKNPNKRPVQNFKIIKL